MPRPSSINSSKLVTGEPPLSNTLLMTIEMVVSVAAAYLSYSGCSGIEAAITNPTGE